MPTLPIDPGALRDPVRRALGTGAAEVRDWDVRPLGNVENNVTGGLYRVRGTASTEGPPVAWSLVLKACRDPGEEQHHDVRAPNFWKREFLAYSSSLLDNLPPACGRRVVTALKRARMAPPGCGLKA